MTLTPKQIQAMFDATDRARANEANPGTFVCDACGDRLEKHAMRKCRGMKLCPECRESARDYFGR